MFSLVCFLFCRSRFVGDMWLDAEEDPTSADTQSNSSASDTVAPIPNMNLEVHFHVCCHRRAFECLV